MVRPAMASRPGVAAVARMTALMATLSPDPSISPSPQQDGRDGLDQNDEIETEASALDIVEIELELLLEGNIASSTDLPDTGQPGDDVEPTAVGQGVLRDLADGRWSGADEGHISFDDAPQLRQLVDTELANDAPDPGDSGVTFHLEGDALTTVIALGHEIGLEALCVGEH